MAPDDRERAERTSKGDAVPTETGVAGPEDRHTDKGLWRYDENAATDTETTASLDQAAHEERALVL